MTKRNPNLKEIPETMLWTLHNRASEAARADGLLRDERAVEIYRALDYDYKRSFGRADGSHAMRSLAFDTELQAFLAAHPDGVIVNLGEGLETQRFRLDTDQALWLSVDLPEAMAVRERFILPDERHRHLPISALDRSWIESVPPGRPVYVTAQGLLMYFAPQEVEELFRDLAERLPGAWFAFDHIPAWLSRKSLRGWWKTRHYRTPAMPWGINRDRIEPTLRAWVPDLAEVRPLPFAMPRGLWRGVQSVVERVPWIRHRLFGITRVRFAGGSGHPHLDGGPGRTARPAIRQAVEDPSPDRAAISQRRHHHLRLDGQNRIRQRGRRAVVRRHPRSGDWSQRRNALVSDISDRKSLIDKLTFLMQHVRILYIGQRSTAAITAVLDPNRSSTHCKRHGRSEHTSPRHCIGLLCGVYRRLVIRIALDALVNLDGYMNQTKVGRNQLLVVVWRLRIVRHH